MIADRLSERDQLAISAVRHAIELGRDVDGYSVADAFLRIRAARVLGGTAQDRLLRGIILCGIGRND